MGEVTLYGTAWCAALTLESIRKVFKEQEGLSCCTPPDMPPAHPLQREVASVSETTGLPRP